MCWQGVVLSFTFHGGIFHHWADDLQHQPPSDAEGAALVSSLCGKGYAGQMLLSQGVCCKIQLQRFGGSYGVFRVLDGV